jgi:peptidoglycan/xylan/chitin deacetylase (PgdA/CDA1 family)
MVLSNLIKKPKPDTSAGTVTTLSLVRDRALKAYADWRVGATDYEKRAHKMTDSVLLTFDDYGTEDQIGTILRILSDKNVKAMFFLQGDWAALNPALVQLVQDSGHIIGNHTFSHPDLLGLSSDDVTREITRGVRSVWLRPPRGRYNSRIRDVARSLGRSICYWSIDSDDWRGVPAQYIYEKVMAEIHPGAVILFHLHAPHTPEALPRLIDAIRAHGLDLTTPDEPGWEPVS